MFLAFSESYRIKEKITKEILFIALKCLIFSHCKRVYAHCKQFWKKQKKRKKKINCYAYLLLLAFWDISSQLFKVFLSQMHKMKLVNK